MRDAHLTLTYSQTLDLIGQLGAAEALYQQNLALRRQLRDRQGDDAVLSSLGDIAQARAGR